MYGLAVEEGWKELQAEIPAAQLQAAGNMSNVTRKPLSLHTFLQITLASCGPCGGSSSLIDVGHSPKDQK